MPVEEIDALNIYQATLVGMRRAVEGLDVQPEFVLTDAMKVNFGEKFPSRAIVHGDALSASIAAASIIAKVTRDRLADQWALTYPAYGFEHNRGYGTKQHLAAIAEHGASPIHRRSPPSWQGANFFLRQLFKFRFQLGDTLVVFGNDFVEVALIHDGDFLLRVDCGAQRGN